MSYDKKTLFSRASKPYIEGYVPEEEYVEKIGAATAQLNELTQLLNMAQTLVVVMCNKLHGWDDCEAACPNLNLRRILRVPSQSDVHRIMSAQKFGVGREPIDRAIRSAAANEKLTVLDEHRPEDLS